MHSDQMLPPLIGRSKDIDTLEHSLLLASNGSPQVTVIAGEPGIGKTRLITELIGIASKHGFIPVSGSSFEEGGAPSFWPWRQCFASLVQELDDDALRTSCRANTAVLAELIPEIAERLGERESPDEISDLQAARFRLFKSVSEFMHEVSRNSPLLFALDDLHWADESTLDLLSFVVRIARDARVMIVGSYRDVQLRRRHPLPKTLGSLRQASGFSRIGLRRLNRATTNKLTEHFGVENRDDWDRVWSSAEGNPFFVGELARLILSDPNSTERVPEGVREAIGRRLDALSEPANAALEVGAVAGRVFSPAIVMDVLADRFEQSEVLRGFDDAATGRIIESIPGSSDRFQFTHSLIQETLLDELSLQDTVTLHAKVLKAKERHHGHEVEKHAAEFLFHARASRSVVGNETVLKYSVIAGENAIRTKSFGEALNIFLAAVDLVAEVETDETIAQLMKRLAYLIIWWLPPAHPQKKVAVSLLNRAFEFYRKTGDYETAIAVVTPAAGSFVLVRVYELLLRAISISAPDTPLAAWLECRAAIAIGIEQDDYKTANEHFSRAMVIAEKLSDDDLKMRVIGMMALSAERSGDKAEAMRLADQVLNASPPVTDLLPIAHAAEATHWTVAMEGDLDRGIDLAEHMIQAGEQLNQLNRTMGGLQSKTLLEIAKGELHSALTTIDHALDRHEYAPSFQYMRLAVLTLIGDEEGALAASDRGDEAVRFIYGENDHNAVESNFIRSDIYWSARALYVGLEDRSALEFKQTGNYLANDMPLPTGWFQTYWAGKSMCLAIGAVVHENEDQSREWYDHLDPQDHTTSLIGMRNLEVFVSRQRLMARLALVMGEHQEAVHWYERAITSSEQLGKKLDLAWSRFELGELLASRSDLHSELPSRPLLEEAASLAEQTGMGLLAKRANAALTAAKHGNSSQLPAGLTSREVEVLREVASGRTNGEIADVLIISQNTVIRHVSNIYTKIGVSSRAEAATWAQRHGIL